jgi:hypothetical protein
MIDTENRHLVAIDAGSPDARVVVCMPPESLSKAEALTFAAHLVAKANAALHEKGLPITTPRTLVERIDARLKSPPSSIRLGPDGRLVLSRALQFLSAVEAVDVAASIVSIVDPDANMLAHVGAVIDAARGGAALARELADPRAASINLSTPRRAARIVDTAAETTTPPPLEELLTEDAIEQATAKRMKGGA